MKNNYIPQEVKILSVKQDSIEAKLFNLVFTNKKEQREFTFEHGQFMMFGLPGVGESAFDICSSTEDNKHFFQLIVRMVGKVTRQLHQLKKGDTAWVRGPFGRGFPSNVLKRRNLLLIGGGCGTITFRSIILDYLNGLLGKNTKLQVFYGCLNENTLLFKSELPVWRKKMEVDIILDKPEKSWKGEKGLITALFDSHQILSNAVALVCGPPVMYKFVVQKLKEHNFKDEDVYLSLERRMSCGIGVCQHCAVGSKYVCTDGSVFSLKEINDYKMPGAF